MLRHPSESFIKFAMTLLRPEAKSDAWVGFYVEQLGYPKPDPMYLAFLRKEIEPKIPGDFQPQNRFHQPSVRFMKDEKIFGLHNPDAATQQSFQLITNLRARPIIEDLLLGRVEAKEVARKVNARLGEFITADAVEAYNQYFWDTTLLKVDEWAVLLRDLTIRREHSLAILQVGPAMALHKHGFQQQLDQKTVLREMLETIYFDFREWKAQPRGKDRTKALATLARSAVLIDERMSEADSALKESLAAFERFRMRQAETQVKGMQQIAPDGNYSGSGAKLLEAKPEGSQ